MLYKDDADKAKERMRAWYERENDDRPVVQITGLRKGKQHAGSWHGWYHVNNLDRLEQAPLEFEKAIESVFFGGESFPSMFVNFGPGSVAAYLGCDTLVQPDTVWFETKSSWDYEKILRLSMDTENYWWLKTKQAIEYAVEHARDNYFVTTADLGATMNVLGSIRGTQTLLMDLLEQPDAVNDATELISDLVMQYYEESIAITKRYMDDGTMTWMGIWFPGKGSDVQCDFSAMMSPRDFERFVVPHLQKQCCGLDHSIYHWDGPGQIPHLEHLLDIPELDGIQWIPGAGNEGVGSPKWFSLYKRIQEKGKLLVLQGLWPHEVEPLLKELSPKGLLICPACNTEEEAREMLKKIEKWTAKYHGGIY